MRSRKSQIIGQTFVYVMGVIIFSVILLYGYSKISGLMERQQDLCIQQMGADMRAKVDAVGQSFDVENYRLRTCGEFNQVCFWNSAIVADESACLGVDPRYFAKDTESPAAKDILDSGSKPPNDIFQRITKCQPYNMAVFQKGGIDVEYFWVGKIQMGNRIALGANQVDGNPLHPENPGEFNCFYAPRGNVYLRIEGMGNKAKISADYPGRYDNPHPTP